MKIDGPGPYDSRWAKQMFGVALSHMCDHMRIELEKLRTNPWPTEPAVICLVRCMRLVAEDYPQLANFAFPWPEVYKWEDAYFEWFDSVEKKIPAKFRGEMRAVGKEEFARLHQALGGNRELLRSPS
jgi:hypothetical protein